LPPRRGFIDVSNVLGLSSPENETAKVIAMVDLSSLAIDPEVLKLIPKSTALELSVLPLSLKNDTVVVAMPEMFRRQLVSDIQFLLGKKVKAVPVPQEILVTAIHWFYGSDKVSSGQHLEPYPLSFSSIRQRELRLSGLDSDASTVTLVNRLISSAIRLGATDVHLEPFQYAYRVRYRIDGVLHEAFQLSIDKGMSLIGRLKRIANLQMDETQRPQEGRLQVRRDERTIPVRLTTVPTDFGERCVLRLHDPSRLQLDLAKLGFDDRDLMLVRQALDSPSGLILVTGPEGSGKMTTLYAALTYLNRPDISITTIEDPIEFNLSNINQMSVQPEIGLTYPAALRAILLQDPNVILIGELRDRETAELAIRAALTGHLVLSTLHTIDAPSALGQLIDMGIEPFLIASSLKMVVAQRLVRQLCPRCKILVSLHPEQVRALDSAVGVEEHFFGSKGCPACHYFGYSGRTGLFEVLEVGSELADLVSKRSTISDLREEARSRGMVTLRQAALHKALRGETSMDEVIRETRDASIEYNLKN
jgi:type IV pilus assembly protein PilB